MSTNRNRLIAAVYDSDKLIHSIECNEVIVNNNNSISILGYEENSGLICDVTKAVISDKYIIILKDKE